MRRQNVAEGPFSLRFEVMDGKGILRVARPGVLIDPPARQVGVEERLSPQQLRSTRFILVWDGGRARQGHLLNRLEELQLDRVELDRWHELEVVVEGGFRYVVLPVSIPPAEPKPQKPKSRRPSLSELRQALDSITVHTEDSEDVDSALASLTGPVPLAPQPRPIAEVAEAPLPGIAGMEPPPVLSSTRPLASPSTYEVQRPVRRMPAGPPAPQGPVLADAPTVFIEGGMEPLALGEADDSVEDHEALALGEADDSVEEHEALHLGGPPVADPPEPTERRTGRPPGPPSGSPSAAPAHAALPGPSGSPASMPRPVDDMEDESDVPSEPAPTVGAAAFYASFTDSEEEAVFSIDLPSHRQSTEHVTVRSGADNDAVVFAREVLPPMRGVAPVAEEILAADELPALDEVAAPPPSPVTAAEPPRPPALQELPPPVAPPAPPSLSRVRTNHDLEDARVELPEPPEAASRRSPGAPPSGPARPPHPVGELRASAPSEEPPSNGRARGLAHSHTMNDEDGVTHRAPVTLVRHMRRKVEEQRARIVELEQRVAELEAALRSR